MGAVYGYGNHISGGGQITQNYVRGGNISGNTYVGGVIGYAVATNLSHLRNYGTNVHGNSVVGGVMGSYFSSPVNNIYSYDATISAPNGGSNIGGIIGAVGTNFNPFTNWANTSNVIVYGAGSQIGGAFGGIDAPGSNMIYGYNSGSVTVGPGSSAVGGIAGFSWNALSNVYNSGLVTAPSSSNVGAVVGQNNGGVWSAYFDSQTSGVATGQGSGNSGGTALTTAQMKSWSNFSGWSISNNNLTGNTNTTVFTGASAPVATWIMFEGQTRPMLQAEWSLLVASPHAVQLMGAAIDADYTLKNNIDLYSGMHNMGDIWATNQSTSTGAGFIPIANGTRFTGTVNGNGFAVNNLYQNITTSLAANKAGLFNAMIGSSISNLGVNDALIMYTGNYPNKYSSQSWRRRSSWKSNW